MKKVFNVTKQLQDCLAHSNIQVHSLAVLEDSVKSQYCNGSKKALIVYRSKVYERIIALSGEKLLSIADEDLTAHIKRGERLLIVLAPGGKKRFVLQVGVLKIFADRFVVSVLDPRHDQRFEVTQAENVGFWQMPIDVVLKLQEAQYTLERSVDGPITGRPADLKAEAQVRSVVLDSIIDREEKKPVSECLSITGGAPRKVLQLVDVSLGGVCFNLPAGQGERNVNQLILCRFFLPAVNNSTNGIYAAGLQIEALAIVRGWKNNEQGDNLHCRFLVRLPEMVEGFFSV